MTIHTRSQSGGLRQKVKAGLTKNNFGKKYKVQRCRINDKTWKYLDMNKNDRDVCLVGRCGIYWSVQDRMGNMFSSKSTGNMGKVDNKGSRGSFIMEKDFASGTIQVFSLVLKSPEEWLPHHLSRRSGKLQTLENPLIIDINQVQNILIQSLETHDQSCISLLKADCL